MGAIVQQGTHFAGKDKHLAGTRTGTPAEHLFHIRQGIRLVGPGGANQIENEFGDVIRDGDFTGKRLGGLQLLSSDDGLNFLLHTTGGAGDDFALFIAVRVINFDEEKEAVFLRFRQRIGAFLFDGILSGENKKGLWQLIGCLADGHAFFLHGFEQGGLSLWRCAVDFVSQDDLGENGTLLEDQFPTSCLGILLNDLRASDVRRHQIRRELNAAEAEVHGISQRFDEQCLGQSGNSLQQAVATCGDGDEDLLDHGILPDDPLAQGSFEFFETRNKGGGGSGVGHGSNEGSKKGRNETRRESGHSFLRSRLTPAYRRKRIQASVPGLVLP